MLLPNCGFCQLKVHNNWRIAAEKKREITIRPFDDWWGDN